LVLGQDKEDWQTLSQTDQMIKQKAQINKFREEKENHKRYQ
jgi:hypothetical protein